MKPPLTVCVREIVCPKCGATELHPDGSKLLIRALKVFDDRGAWSQCLVCAKYYIAYKSGGKRVYKETLHLFDKRKGWFVCR